MERLHGGKTSPGVPERGASLFARVAETKIRGDRWVAEHRTVVLAVCLAVMVLVTAFKYTVFPPNAFFDANVILSRAASGDLTKMDASYAFAIRAFRPLVTATGIVSLVTWNWILLIPGAAIALFLLYKARPQSLAALFVALCFAGLLPFYVFMPGKDFLQYLMFFPVALVLLYVKKEWQKALFAAVLVIPCALLFRSYYILMIGLIAAFYVFALVYRNRLTVGSRSVCILATMLLVMLGFYAVKLIAPGQAQRLFTVRTVTNAGLGRDALSDKVIMDLLPLETSVPGFLGNYLMASVRIAFPFELLKDPFDLPFVLFQCAATIHFIRELIRSRRVQARTAVYAVALAFLFMSFIFEPDFGSWFRHEAAAFPILWLALGMDKKTVRGVNTEAPDGV
ncbi:MAG: hypothetical protein Q4C53_07820 [Clostridia bacterium]|nr:hypothetical protein [Clostridia bacterium]